MSVFQLGPILKARREELGLSQEDLADGICSVPTLSRIENGERMPTKNHFEMLMQSCSKRHLRNRYQYNSSTGSKSHNVIACSSVLMQLEVLMPAINVTETRIARINAHVFLVIVEHSFFSIYQNTKRNLHNRPCRNRKTYFSNYGMVFLH